MQDPVEKHPMVPDKIQNGQMRFAGHGPEAAAELLKKNDPGFGRTQQDNPVNGRDIESLVEHVHHTERVEFARFECAEGIGGGIGFGASVRTDRASVTPPG